MEQKKCCIQKIDANFFVDSFSNHTSKCGMDYVVTKQNVCDLCLSSNSGSDKVLSDKRDMVLDRTVDQDSGNHRKDRNDRTNPSSPPRVILNWSECWHLLQNRCNRMGASIKQSCSFSMDWLENQIDLSYTFVAPNLGNWKYFTIPRNPVACLATIQKQSVKGFIEGLEVCERHPLMRIYISYKSPIRTMENYQNHVLWMKCLQPFLQHKYMLQNIVKLCYPNRKVLNGYEYVSKLKRTLRQTSKTNRRLPSWNFRGIYTTIQTIDNDETNQHKGERLVRFLAKNARHDRSVQSICTDETLLQQSFLFFGASSTAPVTNL